MVNDTFNLGTGLGVLGGRIVHLRICIYAPVKACSLNGCYPLLREVEVGSLAKIPCVAGS